MDIKQVFGEVYKGKRVFITGHTGFKGSWLALWLKSMGAIVKGFSLAPQTEPNHWKLLKLDIESILHDIRDRNVLKAELTAFKPDIVFHLAAQPLVRESYIDPITTYETNVLGTLYLFEACREMESIKAIINVTSDKCYENKEWMWGYRENDPMGGYDPYSSSKGCSELLTTSYRNSYWNVDEYGTKHNVLLASVRSGNVIGGGDWANDRLVPDIVKATVNGKKVYIRNPYSTRPWQHVLEPLYGYLLLGKKLLKGHKDFASGWNFGPGHEANIMVNDIAYEIRTNWNKVKIELNLSNEQPHEANMLMLDSSKAYKKLGWKTILDYKHTIHFTIDWYKKFYLSNAIISKNQISQYISLLNEKNDKY